MGTKRPLKDMIPDLIQHFHKHADYLDFNYKLYKILNGQLKNEVECSLRQEILSPSALCRALQRIPPINIMKKSTDKLSKVYIDQPVRITDKSEDQEIMENIVRSTQLDSVLTEANKLYNATFAFALEPYVQDNKHKVRVLAPHQFLPYSDNPSNPTQMTVFMKLLGKRIDYIPAEFDEFGTKITDEDARETKVIALYSDNEVLVVDLQGAIRTDIMKEMGISSTSNPFGKIPFIYKSKSALELIPYPNQEGYDMSILVPKLLTDLNYAVQFMSHSIIYTRNVELGEQYLHPDTVINLGNADIDGNNPEIDTIDPKIDITENLKLISYQIESHFDQLGIKTKVSLGEKNAESGISKSIDEGDTTAEKKVQTEVFRCVEHELMELIKEIQKVWSKDNVVKENRAFSEDFNKTFRVQFAEMRVAKTERQKLEEISLWRQEGLMSKKQAVRMLKPDFTETQVQKWIDDLEKEAEESFMSDLGSLGPDKNAGNGQFVEGNQAATNEPTTRMNREEDKLNA